MPTLRLLLGDQLSLDMSSLRGYAEGDVVMLCEVVQEARYVRHHKKKLAFVFACMRHCAVALEEAGFRVRYVRLDDPENTGTLDGEVARALAQGEFDGLVITEPGEWRVLTKMHDWQDQLDVPVSIRPDDRFFASLGEFEDWASGKKQLRMEYFYREMRRKTGYLMDGADPVGGQWNFDKDNRKALPQSLTVPERLTFDPDAITQSVLTVVEERFEDHFGELRPFTLPVKREDALAVLGHFIDVCLPHFGDYQDAMAEGEAFLFHSTVSAALNIGLLSPREVCDAVEAAYKAGHAPLNAAEGFVRQVLGWREYVRGLYWLKMPAYKELNALNADRDLPDFYWTAETDMACVADAVNTTRQHAYAHHIQRLMVTGNFALLAGVAPDAINDWYMAVYADAYEWVELPNTHGMAIFADGGIMASKPYAASGAYIDRMSNHCAGCRYTVKEKLGPDACPFNYLYWDFLMRNRQALQSNHRMGMIYRTLDKMDATRRSAIKESANQFLNSI